MAGYGGEITQDVVAQVEQSCHVDARSDATDRMIVREALRFLRSSRSELDYDCALPNESTVVLKLRFESPPRGMHFEAE